MIEILHYEFKPNFAFFHFGLKIMFEDGYLYTLVFDSEQVRDEAYDYFDPFASIDEEYDSDYGNGKFLLNIAIPVSQYTNQVDNYLRHKKLENIKKKIKL